MLRFLAPLILTLSSVTSLRDPFYTRVGPQTAASESQVQFAIENKYDDTGPGAQKQEYAYNTYKTLEDALVAYLDDPDTKLPEHERAKAINKLFSTASRPVTPSSLSHPPRYYNSFQKPTYQSPARDPFNIPDKNVFYQSLRKPSVAYSAIEGINGLKNHPEKYEPFKVQKYRAVKGSPVSLAHYSRDSDLKAAFDQFDPHPKYTYSYGVHDKATGDVKQASETRDGGAVHGFYSFIDPDGHQRTVRYQADDVKGFRATIKKIGSGLAK